MRHVVLGTLHQIALKFYTCKWLQHQWWQI